MDYLKNNKELAFKSDTPFKINTINFKNTSQCYKFYDISTEFWLLGHFYSYKFCSQFLLELLFILVLIFSYNTG